MAESHSTSLKTCFKCGEAKERSEFYKHPRMADGLLGKCKECAKKDAKENYLADVPKHKEYEKKREQMPSRKEQKRKMLQKRRRLCPEKYRANNMVSNAIRDGRLVRQPCEVCGDPNSQGHHDDYSKPLEVRWLCRKHHQMHHGQLKYLQPS